MTRSLPAIHLERAATTVASRRGVQTLRMRGPIVGVIMAAATAAAQAAQPAIPDYVDSLAPFSVRALSGDYAPASGAVTMRDVTPQEWQQGDGIGAFSAVIRSWNGGAKALTGTRLWVHGGGHRDSANNGIYQYDFAGTDAPVGFALLDISDPDAVRAASEPGPGGDGVNGTAEYADYTDGRPHAVHTYDGMLYVPEQEALYRFGGAHWNPAGGGNSFSWRFDLATRRWQRLEDAPWFNVFAVTMYDPRSRKVAVWRAREYAFFRTVDGTWSEVGSASGGFPGNTEDSCGAWDPTRDRGISFAAGKYNVWEIDWFGERMVARTVTPTGDTEILERAAPSVVYDEGRDVYWLFGGDSLFDGSRGPGWNAIYEMDAETFFIKRHELAGDQITEERQRGSYGRFVFLQDWRAIGLVAGVDSPAYVIRLPSPERVPPRNPLGLQASP